MKKYTKIEVFNDLDTLLVEVRDSTVHIEGDAHSLHQRFKHSEGKATVACQYNPRCSGEQVLSVSPTKSKATKIVLSVADRLPTNQCVQHTLLVLLIRCNKHQFHYGQ